MNELNPDQIIFFPQEFYTLIVCQVLLNHLLQLFFPHWVAIDRSYAGTPHSVCRLYQVKAVHAVSTKRVVARICILHVLSVVFKRPLLCVRIDRGHADFDARMPTQNIRKLILRHQELPCKVQCRIPFRLFLVFFHIGNLIRELAVRAVIYSK